VDLAPQIAQIISRLLPAVDKLSSIVGFMANFRNDYIVFKVKLMTKKRHEGARCDQSSKKAAVNLLNQITGEEKDAAEKEKDDAEKEKEINRQQICVTQEFKLRLFDEEKKDGKRWFLTPTEAVLVNIKKISFK
jgi:hypothetical protein